MSRCSYCDLDYCCCCAGADGKSAYEIAVDHGFIGTEQDWLDSLKAESVPFLSSYIEAVGSTQTVSTGQNFAFDTHEDIIDIAGSDIEINDAGTIFTIKSPGLYRVEWNMNLSSATIPVLVGLIENGVPSSAASNQMETGNFASGALINVLDSDIPYTISLVNFGNQVTISNPAMAQNTAVSIRISRFAQGA